jgi:hypothetical protein
MRSLKRGTIFRTIYGRRIMLSPVLAFALLAVALPGFAHADEFTGQPVDDPKDLVPPPVRCTTSSSSSSTQSQSISESMFVSMPSWARNVIMPPLPDQLKPMGKKSLAASGPVVPPVTPPKEPTAPVPSSVDAAAAAAKAAENNPAMITVSPFLQWIKSNPQAAAAQARQQANVYHAGPGPAPAPSTSSDDAYWLPPLMDTTGNTSGGSAAIYSTPQR